MKGVGRVILTIAMVHALIFTRIHAVSRLFPLKLEVIMPTTRCTQYRRNMIKMFTDM